MRFATVILLLAAALPGAADAAVVFERKAADLFVLKVDGVSFTAAVPEIAHKMGVRIERFGDAPFDLTLDIVARSRDEVVEAVAREGGFVAVGSNPTYQIYALDLGAEAPETVATTYYRVEQGDLATVAITLQGQFPAPSDGTGLTVQKLPPINSLVLTGPIKTLLEAVTFLQQIDEKPAMVFVELMVVELFHDQGFNWGFSLTEGSRRQVSDLAYSPGSGSLSFLYNFIDVLDPSFKLNLLALVDEGTARVMTNPRLAVLNGSTGVIRLEQELNIPLVNTGDTGTTVELAQVDAVVSMRITPTVLPSKDIQLDILATVKVFTSTDGTNPSTATNTVDTTVKVRNNETVILGGLLQKRTLDRVSGVPVLRKIPLLGALFRHKSTQVQYDETAIYITPRLEAPGDPAATDRPADELDAVTTQALDGMEGSYQQELLKAEELRKQRQQDKKERRRARKNRGRSTGESR